MENKDIVPAESPKISETTPLVLDEKEVVGTSHKESSLAKLATDLSELSLEIGGKLTCNTPVDATITDSQETAIQVSSNSEGDQSGASTDVEQQETVVSGETSETPTQEPQEARVTESRLSSSTDPEIRGGNQKLFDRTMWYLLLEILLLGVPISEAYYAIKYVRSCDDGDKLPLLLILVAFITFLALLGRIVKNVSRKLSRFDENNAVSWLIIFVGDIFSIILYTAQMAYLSTIEKKRCNWDLYLYACFINIAGLSTLVLLVLKVYVNRRTYNRCINILRG